MLSSRLFSLILNIIALASHSTAAPTAFSSLKARQDTGSSGPVTLIAAHSTSPIHLQSINAAYSRFYIGRPTVSYCPFEDEEGECPPGNVTAVKVGEGGASLYVTVPGGQTIYVLPTGALAFTPAHEEDIPTSQNGTTTGFTYTPSTTPSEPLGTLDFTGRGSLGFLACPLPPSNTTFAGSNGSVVGGVGGIGESGPWQVYADVKGICDRDVPAGNLSACVGFDALGYPFEGTGGAAWQYD